MSQQRPEQVIRRYLDEHGDLEEVAIEHLLVTWKYDELTQEARSLISTALISVGVRVEPPLDLARRHGTVSLSVIRGEAPPAAADPPGRVRRPMAALSEAPAPSRAVAPLPA